MAIFADNRYFGMVYLYLIKDNKLGLSWAKLSTAWVKISLVYIGYDSKRQYNLIF